MNLVAARQALSHSAVCTPTSADIGFRGWSAMLILQCSIVCLAQHLVVIGHAASQNMLRASCKPADFAL